MKFLTFFLLGFLSLSVFSQQEPCLFDHLIKLRDQQYPGYYNMQNEILRNAKDNPPGNRSEVLRIPVVFHVVWHEDSQNIADSVIQSQIEVLNEDYRRLNANAINTREEFLPIAADAHIEFFLAEVDPEGNPTNGIVRRNTDRDEFDLDIFSPSNTLDEVKFDESGGSDAWDTEHYLNIWSANISSPLGQVFGLAYPPEGLDNWPDGAAEPDPAVSGVIVHYTTVGRNNPAASEDGQEINNQGRTAVHEIGHYLGLRHIWGDGFFNGCGADDGIDDTPNAAAAGNYTCDFEANSCDDGDPDMPDNVENYMDYNQDECMNMFTQGQVDVMRYVLENLRPGLLEDQVVNVAESGIKGLEIYPNPAEAFTQLNLPMNSSGYIVTLRNQLGQKVEEHQLPSGTQVIDVSKLAFGSYFVEVMDVKSLQSDVKKLIIVR